jgi:ankyrin repeat protein
LSLFEKKIRAQVDLLGFQWSAALTSKDLEALVGQWPDATLRPASALAISAPLNRNPQYVGLLGSPIPVVAQAPAPSVVGIAAIPFRARRRYDPANPQIPFALCLLFDIAYSAHTSILFRGLFPLGISDFSRAMCLNSEHLLALQLEYFGQFVDPFKLHDGTPLLHYAALVSRNPTLFRLICERSDVSRVDHASSDRTAVFYALRNRNLSILQILINCKADIDRCSIDRRSPLLACLESSDDRRAKFLLDNGASVHRTFSSKYVSVLSYAIQRKDSRILKLVLPYAGNEVNCPDSSGRFPLEDCVLQGFAEGIVLIEKLCPLLNPNLFASPDQHPLHVLLDLELAPQRDARSVSTLLPLLSVKRLDLNVINSAGDTPLLRAVRAGLHEIVAQIAADPRCDVNAPQRDGTTPLFWAVGASVGDGGTMVKSLIAAGAFPGQPNSDGRTPIFAALDRRDPDTLGALLDTGVDPLQWYYKGKLPTDVATADLKELLLKAIAKREQNR